jgi:hypothetical protein
VGWVASPFVNIDDIWSMLEKVSRDCVRSKPSAVATEPDMHNDQKENSL